ncbi:MAG: siderophore-interacting protein [Pseudomonadota bacterium]
MVARVAALDPIAARAIRWGGGDEAGAVPPTFSALRLIRTSDLAVGLRRLTLKGYDLGRFACGGLHLRAIVPLHPGRAPVWPVLEANGATRWPRGADRLHMRVLTLRHMRINSGELDLDVAIHGQGRLSTWAQSAQEGAVLGVMGSGGEAGLPASNGLLLAGDRSALPAIARLLETLPAEATGDLVLDVALETAARAYLPPTRLRLHLLPEGRFPEQVEARLRELGRQRDVRHLWFGGRLDNARKLRRLATNDFKLDPDQHSCTAYWREAPHRSKGT